MTIGYCPVCRKEVALTREEFNVCLFCVLLPTGVGGIIYLLIWLFGSKIDKCVFCRNKTLPLQQAQAQGLLSSKAGVTPLLNKPNKSIIDQTQNGRNISQIKETNNEGNVTEIFCPFCGYNVRSGAQFCPECGGSLADRLK